MPFMIIEYCLLMFFPKVAAEFNPYLH